MEATEEEDDPQGKEEAVMRVRGWKQTPKGGTPMPRSVRSLSPQHPDLAELFPESFLL